MTTSGAGLTDAEAARRLARDGPNAIPAPPPPSPLVQVAAQLVHFFALLLWAAAGLALLAGMPELTIAIVVVVLINGVFAFAQEHRADRAGQRLRAMLPARVTVTRDGRRKTIEAVDLVVGDRVLLDSRDRVCADLELAAVAALSIDESMLSGESVPVRPDVGARAFAGTYVVEGRAEADVVATGRGTRLAGLAAETRGAQRPTSPLTRELHRVVRTVAAVAVAVGAVFFLLATGLGVDPQDGFLLAVGVTVGPRPGGVAADGGGAHRVLVVHETQLGFKLVMWLNGVEFVAHLLRGRRRPRRLQPGPRVLRLPKIDLETRTWHRPP